MSYQKGHPQYNTGRTWFQKGHTPTAPFKKGNIPWNKGLKGVQAGEKHWNWKGGRQTSGNGYIYIYLPEHPESDSRGRVYEHRIVMEKALNRFLLKGEVIDHINGDRKDNRPENLRVFSSNGEHLSVTMRKNR